MNEWMMHQDLLCPRPPRSKVMDGQRKTNSAFLARWHERCCWSLPKKCLVLGTAMPQLHAHSATLKHRKVEEVCDIRLAFPPSPAPTFRPHLKLILPEASSMFYWHTTDSIQNKKLNGDITTSVKHPTWSLLLSMGRNQQDVFMKWSRKDKTSESTLRPILTPQ